MVMFQIVVAVDGYHPRGGSQLEADTIPRELLGIARRKETAELLWHSFIKTVDTSSDAFQTEWNTDPFNKRLCCLSFNFTIPGSDKPPRKLRCWLRPVDGSTTFPDQTLLAAYGRIGTSNVPTSYEAPAFVQFSYDVAVEYPDTGAKEKGLLHDLKNNPAKIANNVSVVAIACLERLDSAHLVAKPEETFAPPGFKPFDSPVAVETESKSATIEKQPTAETQPTIEKRPATIKKPTAEKPSAEKPSAEKPSAEKPSAEKQKAEKQKVKKPKIEKPKIQIVKQHSEDTSHKFAQSQISSIVEDLENKFQQYKIAGRKTHKKEFDNLLKMIRELDKENKPNANYKEIINLVETALEKAYHDYSKSFLRHGSKRSVKGYIDKVCNSKSSYLYPKQLTKLLDKAYKADPTLVSEKNPNDSIAYQIVRGVADHMPEKKHSKKS